MARNTKYTAANNTGTNGTSRVKHYGDSSFVAKKNQEAKETLQKFPVPDKYAK